MKNKKYKERKEKQGKIKRRGEGVIMKHTDLIWIWLASFGAI